MMQKKLVTTTLLLSMLFSANAWSHWYHAKVTQVIDGDTVHVLSDENLKEKIRLISIDAPERGQPYGQQSKQALTKLIQGKKVRVEPRGRDQYQRLLATLYKNDTNVNHWMVEHGHAWAYTKHNVEPLLEKAQQKAREKRAGMWESRSQQRVPPWQWRHQQQSRQ